MINPAQYNAVLGKASDDQLMAMLRRPDKIPSQFIVAEINRRQHMRQAAMAEQQKQAQVIQAQMMDGQAQVEPQPAPQPPQTKNVPVREPQGIARMNIGGQPGSRQGFAIVDQMIANGDMRGLEKMATDSSVIDTYGADVKRYANQKYGQLTAQRNTPPVVSTSNTQPPAVSDFSEMPYDASDYTAEDEALFNSQLNALFPGGGNMDPSNLAGKDGEGTGITADDFPSNPYSTAFTQPSSGQTSTGSQTASGGVTNASATGSQVSTGNGSGQTTPAPFTINLNIPGSSDDNKPAVKPKSLDEISSGLDDMLNRTKALRDKPGQKSNLQNTIAGQIMSTLGIDLNEDMTVNKGSGITTGQDNNQNQGSGIRNTQRGNNNQTSGSGTDKQYNDATAENMAKTLIEENTALRQDIANRTKTFNEAQKGRVNELQTEFDAVSTAMQKLIDQYDQNSTKPENRIWKAVIDAGIELATTNEANFFRALGQAGKKGIATFDTLNKEAKENLLKKYGATVDLAKAKYGIKEKMFSTISQIEQSSLEADNKVTMSNIDDNRMRLDAAIADRDFNLKEETADANIRASDAGIDQGWAKIDIAQGNLEINQGNLRLAQTGQRLDALSNVWGLSNEMERNAISRIAAEKPAAAVEYLDSIAERFGEDTAKAFVLGSSNTKDRTPYAAITSAAVTLAEADYNNQTPIPGVKPANGDEYTLNQYRQYHENSMMSLYGGNVSGAPSQNADPLGIN